jgi:hypothetical protein
MGCDIHLVLERKHKDKWVGVYDYGYRTLPPGFFEKHYSEEGKYIEGRWFSYACKRRNYEAFAKMAGVRGEGPDPKGMPDDASDLSLMISDHWGIDGHSHSWLTLPEAVEIFLSCEEDQANLWFAPDAETDVRRAACYLHYFGVDDIDQEYNRVEDYRIVFWFDN